MKKISMFCFLFIGTLFPGLAQLPAWQWSQKAGGTSTDLSQCISYANGNLYVAGHYKSDSIIFGSISLKNTDVTANTNDIFIAKYDISGNALWAKNIKGLKNDYCYDISADDNGNVYIAGSFTSSALTFDTTTIYKPGQGTYNDILIAKYGPDGTFIWARVIGNGLDNIANCLTTDGLGNVYVSGRFQSDSLTFGNILLTNSYISPNFSSDIFVVKYTNTGQALWARAGGGSDGTDIGQSIATDQQGNIYVGGNFYSSNITFGNITLTNSSQNATADIVLIKYDSQGNALWAKSAGGNYTDEITSLKVNGLGSVYIAGRFSSASLDFDGINIESSDSTVVDGFVARYNYNGTIQWAKQMFTTTEAIAVLNDGGLLAAGTFDYTGYVIDTVSIPFNGRADILIAEFDVNSNLVWYTSAGGKCQEGAMGITLDEQENVYITGYFNSDTLTFNNTLTNSVQGAACLPNGNTDIFLTGLGNYSSVKNVLGRINSITIYPNPANSELSILPENLNIELINIYTIEGKLVLQGISGYKKIDVSMLQHGMYMSEIKTSDVVYRTKWIKN